MRIASPTGSPLIAVYVTSESKDKVASYYKHKLGSQLMCSLVTRSISDESLLVAEPKQVFTGLAATLSGL
jgi:hypothetical protein